MLRSLTWCAVMTMVAGCGQILGLEDPRRVTGDGPDAMPPGTLRTLRLDSAADFAMTGATFAGSIVDSLELGYRVAE